MVRTYIKRVDAAIEAGDAGAASTALTEASPLIDKMVTKGIMHKNTASRKISRLSSRVKAIGA